MLTIDGLAKVAEEVIERYDRGLPSLAHIDARKGAAHAIALAVAEAVLSEAASRIDKIWDDACNDCLCYHYAAEDIRSLLSSLKGKP